jgi:hypothetical protein
MDSGSDPFLTLCSPTPQDGVRIQRVEGGLPHSEIPGSKLVRSSPGLIAAYHVLHRLSAPRHPPDALKTLDCSHDRCPPSLDGRLEQKDQPPGSRLKAYACRTHPAAVARASQDEVLATGYVPSSRFQTPTRHVRRRTHGEFLDSSRHRQPTLDSHRGGWWRQTGSNQLSSIRRMVEPDGIEPTTSSLQS